MEEERVVIRDPPPRIVKKDKYEEEIQKKEVSMNPLKKSGAAGAENQRRAMPLIEEHEDKSEQ